MSMRNLLMILLFDGMITIPLITVIVVLIVKPQRNINGHSPTFGRRVFRSSQSPLEIVQERYAHGEIDLAELENMVKTLLRSQNPGQRW